jgi:hypothetical protein
MQSRRDGMTGLFVGAMILGVVASATACAPDPRTIGAYGYDYEYAVGAGSAVGGGGCGSYTFTLACDVDLMGVHQCTEFYGNFPSGYPSRSSDENACKALKGTVLPGKCSTANTTGACTTTTTSGSYGESTVTFRYEGRWSTRESFQMSCARVTSKYAPPGETPASPGSTASSSCGGYAGP